MLYNERVLIFNELESLHFRCFFLGAVMWVTFSFNEGYIHSHNITYIYHLANIVWVLY